MTTPTLKAFYFGNLAPWERRMVQGSEAKRIVKELSETGNLLSQSLPPEFQPLLDRLIKAQGYMDGIVAETSYIDGFKTEARFMLEILDDAHKNLKPITV